MRRALVIVSIISVATVFIPTTGAGLPAPEGLGRPGRVARADSGVWDPDDVTGRFDLRWVGATYTAAGEIHLSVSFYDGFERRFLPRSVSDRYSHVKVHLSGALQGWFVRRPGGRIAFVWGDFGSNCCERARVRRPSSNVLSVVFDPCPYVYANEIDRAQGESYWRPRKTRATDRTGVVDLAQPDCEG